MSRPVSEPVCIKAPVSRRARANYETASTGAFYTPTPIHRSSHPHHPPLKGRGGGVGARKVDHDHT